VRSRSKYWAMLVIDGKKQLDFAESLRPQEYTIGARYELISSRCHSEEQWNGFKSWLSVWLLSHLISLCLAS
jgi:hypothetical protein